MVAALNGRVALVELLARSGANVEAMDRLGETALTLAAERGLTAVLRVLVARGANGAHQNIRGLTALQVASHVRNKRAQFFLNDVDAARELAAAGDWARLRERLLHTPRPGGAGPPSGTGGEPASFESPPGGPGGDTPLRTQRMSTAQLQAVPGGSDCLAGVPPRGWLPSLPLQQRAAAVAWAKDFLLQAKVAPSPPLPASREETQVTPFNDSFSEAEPANNSPKAAASSPAPDGGGGGGGSGAFSEAQLKLVRDIVEADVEDKDAAEKSLLRKKNRGGTVKMGQKGSVSFDGMIPPTGGGSGDGVTGSRRGASAERKSEAKSSFCAVS